MSDDHSKLVPLLPISNRTVKRLRANDSVHPHVKVGHRQTPIKPKAQPRVGLLDLWNLIYDLLERSDNTPRSGLLRWTLTCAASYVGAKVGHRQTPYKQQSPPREGFVVLCFSSFESTLVLRYNRRP